MTGNAHGRSPRATGILCAGLIVAAAWVPWTAMAQSPPEAIVRSLVSNAAIPAAAAGRATADGLVVAVAGDRVLGGDDPVREGDRWHLGSLTKSMTATLAARLVERGLIRWDSTIGEVLGASHSDMLAEWRDTPLRALLTHSSGMEPNLGRIAALRLRGRPRADYVAAMLSDPPRQQPGGFLYSNAGYVVAGAMLEAAVGASWEALIAAEVFGPLGISSAGFGPPQGETAIQGHRTRLFGGIRPAGQGFGADNIPALGPAGRVHLSAGDMMRYLRAHLLRDPEFLSAGSWAELHDPVGPEGYAMGWGVGEDGNMVHSGSNTFWYAVAYIDRAAGEAIFVAVNSGDLAEVVEPVDSALRDLLSAPPPRQAP